MQISEGVLYLHVHTCISTPTQDNPLDSLLQLDHDLTQWLCIYAWLHHTWWIHWVKAVSMCLELSGHGVLWFGLVPALILPYLITSDPAYLTHAANLLTLLVTDIIIVAPIKLFFKRPRPATNQGTIPMSVSSVDHYAFPSGHASRCVALAAYFCYTPPFLLRTHCWYIWALVVSLSRVLLGRHHVSDVVAGMTAGLFIFETIRQLGLLWQL